LDLFSFPVEPTSKRGLLLSRLYFATFIRNFQENYNFEIKRRKANHSSEK